MKVEFTIGWAWVEVICHVLAAFFYIATGFDVSSGRENFGFFTLIAAIALTFYGASL